MDGANLMAMTESNRLTLAERKRFTELKAALKELETSCWDYFATLAQIQSAKLYRETHSSFEHFIETETPFGQSRVYQMIETCQFRQKASTVVEVLPNERQYRELAKIEPEKRLDAWQEIVSDCQEKGIEPTAKIVAEVRNEKFAKEEPKPAPAPAREREAGDEPLTLQEEIDHAIEDLRPVKNAFNAAKRAIEAIEDLPCLGPANASKRRMTEYLDSAIATLYTVTPVAICPRCRGRKCVQCGNEGWVNSVLKKSLEKADRA